MSYPVRILTQTAVCFRLMERQYGESEFADVRLTGDRHHDDTFRSLVGGECARTVRQAEIGAPLLSKTPLLAGSHVRGARLWKGTRSHNNTSFIDKDTSK